MTCACVPVLRESVLWAQNVAFGVTIVLQKLQTLAAYRASRKEANDKLAAANEQIVSSSKQVWHYCHNGDAPQLFEWPFDVSLCAMFAAG